MKATRNFSYKELVPPEIWRSWGAKSRWFLDRRAVEALQWLRDKIGAPVYVNDWPLGGDNTMRGFRPPGADVGALLSQHRFGRAFDASAASRSHREVYDLILDNQQEAMAMGITTLEDIEHTPGWVHFDTREPGDRNSILIVQP